MNALTIKLNADGTFKVDGKDSTLGEVIKLARERRDAANGEKRAAYQAKKAERVSKRLARAEERATKAAAELAKAKALAKK